MEGVGDMVVDFRVGVLVMVLRIGGSFDGVVVVVVASGDGLK